MSLIRDHAIRLLSRREHSRFELKQKLLQKRFPEKEIEKTLDQLTQENLQSDDRFAHSYVRYRTQAGFGPLRLIAELHERGIVNHMIACLVDMHSDQWEKQLQVVAKKKFSDIPAKNLKEKNKQFRFLISRGFSADMIAHIASPS